MLEETLWPFIREVLLKFKNMLTMNGTDSFWSKNTQGMFYPSQFVNVSVTFERSSFPLFVNFSLNTDEIGVIRLPVGRE